MKVTEAVLEQIDVLCAVFDDAGTRGEFDESNERLAIRVILRRQREAARASLVLANNSMGHLGVSFVRPACEEFIWLSYLSTLGSGDTALLLRALANEEGWRGIKA